MARRLGIKQPSVSTWVRIPADRVLAVEAATGVRREQLRPDLYSTRQPQMLSQLPADDIERARASLYFLLARLLRNAPTASFLEDLARLRGNDTPLGMAQLRLAEAAAGTTEADASSEYFALFIGVGRGELLPYASYYLTGFLHERPLARVREDLAELGVERADGNFDPEDHIGLLLEVLGAMAVGTFDGSVARQKMFFDRHVAPWAERFFADLAVSPSAKFYKAVAALGSCFVAVEREAFEFGE